MTAIWISKLLLCNTLFAANAFPTVSRHVTSFMRISCLFTQNFDFSSPEYWDNFYQSSNDVCEWHSSINQTELIRRYIPEGCSCLITGCGNSRLPHLINQLHAGKTKITCLDSSMACLKQLKQQLQKNDNIQYICGDAIALTKTLDGCDSQFDVIIDKGLTDALLCGEGWDTPLMLLLRESAQVLNSPGGMYILVSYTLPSPTQKFIQEASGYLRWSFGLTGTNDRVQISIATRR